MAKKLTSAKAKKILHDKSVHGHPLTEQQRKFFGAIAGGAKPYKAEEGGWLDKYEAQKGVTLTAPSLVPTGYRGPVATMDLSAGTINPTASAADREEVFARIEEDYNKKLDTQRAQKTTTQKTTQPSRGDLQSYFSQIREMREAPKMAAAVATARKQAEQAASLEYIRRNQSYLSAADMSPGAVAARKKATEDYLRRQAQQRSALAQTFGSFTPSGSPAAGAIGAETFVNLNPITGPAMSAGRLTQQVLGENPYGFDSNNAWWKNAFSGLGFLGDVAGVGMLRSMKPSYNAPASSQALSRLNQQIRPLITRQTGPSITRSIVRGPIRNPYGDEFINDRLGRNVVGEELPEHLRPRLIDQEGNPMSIEDLDVKPTPPRVPTAEELALSQRLKERNQRVIDAFTNKSSSNFKSEIDWSKWNPDTPKYPELINEYNAIEESTKKAGTWMTQPRDYSIFSTVDEINLNGLKDKLEKGLLSASEEEVAKRMIPRLEAQKVKSTTFQGSPEQFIQQQSSWFKKAFPQGAEKTYRGTHGEMMTEKLYENYPTGRGIFTGDEATAQHYTSTKGKTFDLYHPKSKNSYDIDVEGRSWREVPIEGLPGMTSKKTLLGKPVADTDDIATWMENSGVDYVTMRNIFDGIAAKYSRIVNNKPGNFLKSATGNVGFFDMTNPNIYKSILPYVIPGTLVTGAVSSAQKKENGGWLDKYEQGGMVLKQKTKDNYGTKPNPNEVDVSLPPGFVGLAYNTKGRNYSPAWGGQFQDGGDIEPKVKKGKDFLEKMANSPLFAERYATMTSRPLENIDKSEIENYRKNILENLRTVNIGKESDYPGGGDGAFHLSAGTYWKTPHSPTQKPHTLYVRSAMSEQPTVTHELSHASTKGELPITPTFEYDPKLANNEYDEMYYKSNKAYYTHPTEVKARRDAVAEYMMDEGLWNPLTEKFTGEHYDKIKSIESDILKKIEKNEPSDKSLLKEIGVISNFQDISKPYNKEETIRIFNSFVKNNNVQSNVGSAQNGGNLIPAMAGANQTVPMMQMGGSLPGAVGFTYARTAGAAPSNGPYAKKTKASAQNGQEMKYYQEGLDFTPKTISQNGSRTPIYVSDPNDPRLKSYQDSLNLFRAYNFQRVMANPLPMLQREARDMTSFGRPTTPLQLKRMREADARTKEFRGTYESLIKDPTQGLDPLDRALGDVDIYRYYQRLRFNEPVAIGNYSSPDIVHKTIKPIGSYFDGIGMSPIYKNPVQPIFYEPEPELPSLRQRFAPIEPERDVNLEYTLPTPRQPILPKPKKLYIQEEEKATPLKDFIERMQQRAEERKGERKTKKGIKSQLKCFAGVCRDEDGNIVSAQDGSEIPVDSMGYWNPDNWGNPVIIPSTDITMEGVDQPLIGISDTGDVQYMEPGEDYEFDGEYVTEYPVAQRGKKVYSSKDIKAKPPYPEYPEGDPRRHGLFYKYSKEREPIFVDDPNDPRLRSYQDSLRLYNITKKFSLHPPTSRAVDYNVPFNAVTKEGMIPDSFEPGSLRPLGIGKFREMMLQSLREKIKPLGYQYTDASVPVYKKPVQPVVYRPEPEIEIPGLKRTFPPMEVERDINLDYTLPTPKQPTLPTLKKVSVPEKPEREKNTPIKDFIQRAQQKAEERKGERKTRKGIKSQLKCFAGVCRDEDGNIVARDGVSVNNADAQPIEKLDQLLNFTNYNKPTKGGWLDKYN